LTQRLPAVTLEPERSLSKTQVKYFKDFLSAVKWMGNAGSHEVDVLNFQDFVGALGLIERVLKDMYLDDDLETFKELASEISKTYGKLKK